MKAPSANPDPGSARALRPVAFSLGDPGPVVPLTQWLGRQWP